MDDFRSHDTWMVFKIMGEFVEGFETLRQVGPAISIFGSNRLRRSHPFYKKAVKVAELLSKEGFSIISGAGPGMMEAANRGARLGRGESVGLNIRLPVEQKVNPYSELVINFDYFFARKVMFARYASGYVVMPGGLASHLGARGGHDPGEGSGSLSSDGRPRRGRALHPRQPAQPRVPACLIEG
jgi:uncharacterized protein (TIGR00725 family)